MWVKTPVVQSRLSGPDVSTQIKHIYVAQTLLSRRLVHTNNGLKSLDQINGTKELASGQLVDDLLFRQASAPTGLQGLRGLPRQLQGRQTL